ncbi:hypothetical protein NM208_g14272 [Fusarium decemcellulare]|uniref:Uncharacterized protein n=1 Tax=Fusarium decemcellulare TaxID=57161 RepID=A0ACC1RHW1_9HYPO|nr:hypothetical protein NM208_g14272 [Fusarium decemcellulare]
MIIFFFTTNKPNTVIAKPLFFIHCRPATRSIMLHGTKAQFTYTDQQTHNDAIIPPLLYAGFNLSHRHILLPIIFVWPLDGPSHPHNLPRFPTHTPRCRSTWAGHLEDRQRASFGQGRKQKEQEQQPAGGGERDGDGLRNERQARQTLHYRNPPTGPASLVDSAPKDGFPTFSFFQNVSSPHRESIA